MSDEFDLDQLADALKAAPPAPDAARKAANLRLAEKNFDRAQESARGLRPTPEASPNGALIKGVAKMFHSLTARAAMVTTTAIVAVGIIVVATQPDLRIPGFGQADGPGTITTPDMRPDPRPQVNAPAAMVKQAPVTAGGPVAREGTESLAPMTELAPMAEPMPPSPVMATRVAPPVGYTAARVADDTLAAPLPDTEEFANADTNPLKITAEDPVSTFSIDVDTASWSVIRSSLMAGYLPPKEAVRIEEMINYFPYDYPAPAADSPDPFRPTVTVMGTPWNEGTQLVQIALQGKMPALEDRPPLNIVFLIDTSGSMDAPNKLGLLKQSFRLMLGQLRPEDEVSIVTYAGSAGQVLAPTPAGERSTILAALERLEAGGSTAGQEGLQQAYQVAESMSGDGEVTRVILATDGDFNVGISDPDALRDFIAKKRDSGVYLSVLGFGRGNLDDATMQALAQNGNGQAAYIDTLSEAQKVLVDQLTGALFPIADDVKVQVEFNPAEIAEYRLIGYETRALKREDFNNDAVDAGEIGAGHQVTAIYEVTPVGSGAVMTDALRYQAAPEGSDSGELGFLKLRYKAPGEDVSKLIAQPILPDMGTPGDDQNFAAAIAGFGQLLRGDDKYLGAWDYADAIALAAAHKGADRFGYRAEAVKLMRLAETLSQ